MRNKGKKNMQISSSGHKHESQYSLAKKYLKILFAISRNRTDEITKKFYMLDVVHFLTSQIDLEFNISEIRERFL